MHHDLCIFLGMPSRNTFFVLKNAQEDSVADTDDLEKELHNIWNSVKGVQVAITGASDTSLVKGTALLGLAVIRLDKTSSRLAWVNIGLTVIIVAATLARIRYVFLRQ